MGRSLGEYVIKKSSSVDTKNIKWTKKNPKEAKPKKRKAKKTSPTNIIYTETKESVQKNFKIEEDEKLEKKKTVNRTESSSASNCNIQQGFKRPGR